MIDPMDDVVSEQSKAGVSGLSGANEPEWPKLIPAAETKDGDIIWTEVPDEQQIETRLAPGIIVPNGSDLGEAIARFTQAFADRSFSQRHEELGKMINCHLCGRRHRLADPLLKDSTAHGEHSGLREQPTVHAPSNRPRNAVVRLRPHHNDKVRRFAKLSEKIYKEDFEPYFTPDPDDPTKYIRQAQLRAALILKAFWLMPRIERKRMQDVSRRINRGLLPGGSR